ncbi:MAG: hypothetical protein ABIO88_11805 [Burkholderiaceae bacterium]
MLGFQRFSSNALLITLTELMAMPRDALAQAIAEEGYTVATA